MDYTTAKENDSTAIFMKGRLTFNDHEKFRNLLDELEAQNAVHLVVDLQSLESIDSVGLGLLMIARDKAKERNGKFVLRNPQGEVKRVFAISKASVLFTIQ
ncbi:putative Anti-sigma factor antagonist [Rhodospirillaceae bacterium LM-1]|nr:putative Anti-sigma factor antagonist [Rhodospirillaceae bacterium LM-1]